MKKQFIIQNAIDRKYWYGFYSNKNWTTDILEAKTYDDREALEDWLKCYSDEFSGMMLIIIETWVQDK